MISKTAKTKSIILDLLSDGMEHTSDEMRSRLREEGIEVDKQSSTLKMAIYQLRVNGSEIYSRDRGVYQLKEEKKTGYVSGIYNTDAGRKEHFILYVCSYRRKYCFKW